jgi:hypothetical protein
METNEEKAHLVKMSIIGIILTYSLRKEKFWSYMKDFLLCGARMNLSAACQHIRNERMCFFIACLQMYMVLRGLATFRVLNQTVEHFGRYQTRYLGLAWFGYPSRFKPLRHRSQILTHTRPLSLQSASHNPL